MRILSSRLMTRPSKPPDSSLLEAARLLGGRVRRDEPLGALTTYRVGGTAALFMTVDSLDDLAVISRVVRTCEVPVLVVGRGSNMLVADGGYAGLAIVLGPHFAAIEVHPSGDGSSAEVHVGGAVPLPVLARRSVAEGLRGMEWAVGIPGSMGGAVVMNAGGHGSEMASVLRSVHLFDLGRGEDEIVPVEQLELSYRRSTLSSGNLSMNKVVLGATIELAVGDAVASERELADVVRWRREHQPGGQNAGSVFTNPKGDSAGRLVEVAGCKGLRIGSAEVSRKHANFIQADPNGSAADVAALIAEVRTRVEVVTGVRLSPELRTVGFSADVVAAMTGR